jgi:hypothetical protein
MTYNEAIASFGLPLQLAYLNDVRRLLAEEIEREREENSDQELLRTFCAQLFSAGLLEDVLRIWAAKNCNFDTFCGLDVQFLCGAGLLPTKQYLAASAEPNAAEALAYVEGCEQGGNFDKFTPAIWLAHAQRYYGLIP